MSTVVTNGYQIFTDVDGLPLEEGYIFIGEPGRSPVSNPKNVYWDSGLTIPATDIRTSGGYPQYAGSPGRLYTDGPYSILVQNRDEEQVYLQLYSLALIEGDDPTVANPDLAGGLPLGSILPLTGDLFTGFLELGTEDLEDEDYPDLAASGNDYVSDNGDGTFNLLNSAESTDWVENSDWTNFSATITHDLLKNMTDLDIQVFLSSGGTEATAIKVLDSVFDQASAAAEFNGIALVGIGTASFRLQTGTNGVSVVNTDGTQIILTNQTWYYRVDMKRKDAPYPGQISYVSLASAIDGGASDARVIAIRLRRDTEANWASENPVLLIGEAGYTTDTEVLKIGDGSTAWNSLNPVNTAITASLTGIIGTDRTVLENDGGTVKVSIGSVIEADGTLYSVSGASATPSGTAEEGAYLFFDPSTGNYTWSLTAGTMDAAKGGIYDESNRRQCRWVLTSATTWNQIVAGESGADVLLGNRKLYLMDQNVRSDDSVEFANVEADSLTSESSIIDSYSNDLSSGGTTNLFSYVPSPLTDSLQTGLIFLAAEDWGTAIYQFVVDGEDAADMSVALVSSTGGSFTATDSGTAIRMYVASIVGGKAIRLKNSTGATRGIVASLILSGTTTI